MLHTKGMFAVTRKRDDHFNTGKGISEQKALDESTLQ